jgi:hypothetical protein
MLRRTVRVLLSRSMSFHCSASASDLHDFDQQAALWGNDLRKELARVYSQDAPFMIVCLSDDYPERDWTTFKLEIGKEAAAKRTEDYLLPLIVGEKRPRIIGLPESVGHISLADRSLDDVAVLAREKVLTLPPIVVTPGGRGASNENELFADILEETPETAAQ